VFWPPRVNFMVPSNLLADSKRWCLRLDRPQDVPSLLSSRVSAIVLLSWIGSSSPIFYVLLSVLTPLKSLCVAPLLVDL